MGLPLGRRRKPPLPRRWIVAPRCPGFGQSSVTRWRFAASPFPAPAGPRVFGNSFVELLAYAWRPCANEHSPPLRRNP
jgi:hypothetical protein